MKKTYKLITAFIVLLSLVTLKMGAQISGTVTINSGMATTPGVNYQTFNALATDLNTNGINGPLVVDVVTGTGPYVEQVTFTQITGMSATNTITINGNNNLLTFSGSSGAPHTLLLNGTDYLRINDLQMSGTNATYAMVAILMNAANNNYFSACTFSCPTNGTSSYQIPFSISASATFPSGGGNADNNTAKTCTMSSGYYALFLYGLTSAPYTQNNSFIDCRITDWYYYCLYTYYAKNLTFRGCTFDRSTRTTLTGSGYFCYGWYMQGFMFEQNTLRDFWNGNQTLSGTYYAFYYMCYGNPDPANRNTFRNNIIRDMKWNGTTYWFYYNYYGGIDFVHNTFSFDNPVSTSGSTYVFYYCYDYQVNNTFVNNNFTFTQAGSGTKYAYYFTTSYPMSYVSNNNYYLTSTNANIGNYGGVATTLAQWQGYGADLVGYNLDPMYASLATGDLHPTNAALNNLGAIKNVPTDNLNMPRSQITPDIGALEFLSANCSGVPTASSIISPTYALCPGTAANLLLNGFTSDLGIVYQWVSNTTSAVGPWNVIPGANSVNYTTPPNNVMTYYGVAMTCTNAAGSATAVTTISIAGITTNTAPYFENFDGINKANELPNCSWYSPTLGSTALTYTSSNTLGRTPRSGTSFASFVYNPAGAKFFYTNGIYLTAGITYSAALWFQTEYYGYNNWSDLSILYGTTQTTTGLVSIASTNGPAVSNVYKSLSNTFQVPATGLYYVAIRATSTSGSAQFLSWDDLSITIPCSVNSPTLALNTTTTSVCAGDQVILTATGADTYTWNTGATTAVINESPTNSGVYTVVGSSSLSGCTSTLTQMISVNPSPIVLAYASSPSVCSGSPVNLNAISPGTGVTYVWNTGATTAFVTLSPTVSATYTVLGTNSFGCIGMATQAVAVNPLPTIAASSSQPNEMCVGEMQTLTASGGVTYLWSVSGSGALLQGNPVTINPTSTTVYTVTGTNANGCSNKATITQNVAECLSIKENNTNHVSVYPNPTSGALTIELNNTSEKTIIVTDVTGRIISSSTSALEVVNVNLSNLSNGIYYVKIQSATSSEVVKVVKQ